MRLPVMETAAVSIVAMAVACSKSTGGETDRQQASATASVAPPPGPASAFDALWASAATRDTYRPYLALKLSKTVYCNYLEGHAASCGDQFEPDKQYKQDLSDGKVIRDSIWRAEISEGFGNIAFRGDIGPGAFDVKRSVIPFSITWPIRLGEGDKVDQVEAAKRRLPIDGEGILWKETPERIAGLKFADGAAARKWSEGGLRTARIVFKITDAVMGRDPLLIINVLGMQLRDDEGVLAEDLAMMPDAGNGRQARQADAATGKN